MQSLAMDADWASRNLQVIRTLMERSARYRRALAPVLIVIGIFGVVAAVVPCFVPIEENGSFAAFWMAVGLAALVAAFVLVRGQALKEAEPFWSSPTRRVTQAFLPAFFIGFIAGLSFICLDFPARKAGWILPPIWMVCYGSGLHAAGFFMRRGIKLLGWIFVILGSALGLTAISQQGLRSPAAGHYAMGIFFGLMHVGCGVYLYFTEKGKNET